MAAPVCPHHGWKGLVWWTQENDKLRHQLTVIDAWARVPMDEDARHAADVQRRTKWGYTRREERSVIQNLE